MAGASQESFQHNLEITISPTTPSNSAKRGLSPADYGKPISFAVHSIQASPSKDDGSDDEATNAGLSRSTIAAGPQTSFSEPPASRVASLQGSNSNNLSGLVSNVHRTTGKEPPGLVGASTTISGDNLFVFGGRRLRPQRLSNTLYQLDLIKRHWTKLETSGDHPSPRFFHSVCALGDSKLVCFGGMALAASTNESANQSSSSIGEATMTVTADVYIYDIPSHTWSLMPTTDSPARRYAHCATILPSSAVFSSASAPLSALRHNPPSNVPNQGTLGMSIDGRGGAEMIVVGGQDGQSHFIDTIEVFNLRSLKWTSSIHLNKSYGAYRSIVAPLVDISPSQLGSQDPITGKNNTRSRDSAANEEAETAAEHSSGSPMLIFSNYNFLNTKIELQVRNVDGTLTEMQSRGEYRPPGLRFPNGGIINNVLIVSGTFITSSQQEYMVWALDLRKLIWHRVDVGGPTVSSGSWNRGLLWNKRNTFVILGSRNRRLGDDYNARRINFSNICFLELEALGLYENTKPAISSTRQCSTVSRPTSEGMDERFDPYSGDSQFTSENLGLAGLRAREICDMEILARDGERIPVNSRVLQQRWGPYLQQLFREDLVRADDMSEAATLTDGASRIFRNRSSISTVTPSTNGNAAGSISDGVSRRPPSAMSSSTAINVTKQTNSAPPSVRSRVLYLPHTYLTIRALVHYLYAGSLPPLDSAFCTPQILCSLLQIARPYRVHGLLEATVERLHQLLDARNTAAVFNAAAMAAGGGDTIRFAGDLGPSEDPYSNEWPRRKSSGQGTITRDGAASQQTMIEDDSEDAESNASASSASMSDIEDSAKDTEEESEVWQGSISAVVGLQKRGLRGLMEGRRLREQGRFEDVGAGTSMTSHGPGASGLGIG